ncbi:MAG: hypothetical protein VX000_14225, partial [Myxococcota bacterium]|nr:hypothetical protein [Myxococcota bacterium]
PTTVDIRYDKQAPLDDASGGTGGEGSAGGDDGGATATEVTGRFLAGHESDGGWVGAIQCEAWWDVAGLPASTACPDCGFTIDWAYQMSFSLDAVALDLPAGCEATLPGFLAEYPEYGEQMLEMSYLGLWGFSTDYSSEDAFMVGYHYYGTPYWRQLPQSEVTAAGGAVEFRSAYTVAYDSTYGEIEPYSVTRIWGGSVAVP